jgi:hypothetical protein
LRENFVANVMPMRVIDFLEMIHINHQKTQWTAITLGTHKLTIQSIIQVSAVVQPGQTIAKGLLSKFLLKVLNLSTR